MITDKPEAARSTDTGGRSARGESAAAISNAIVRLLRTQAGRGPTKARTLISSDLVVTTLRDCLTTADKTLADNGDADLVMRARASLHDAIRSEAIATVEEITGRQVAAYLRDQSHNPDVAVIVFVFAPSTDLKAV